ncbi:hypothetical protein VSU19_10970 [Verrucomicrobiales bacterium BCK34]|nr:hypothetical protein [Verrucomicrobiales bacterium BCK34]
MPVCLDQLFPLWGTEMNFCAAALSEWWIRGLESGSTWIALAVVFAGIGGLVFGWLIGRPSAEERRAFAVSDNDPLMDAALRWRHEKLILTERQQRESRERVARFSEFLQKKPEDPSIGYAASLFALTEAVRDARQTVGTDFSRLKMVTEQLTALREDESAPRPETIEACLGMADKQVANLVKNRDILKSVSALVLPLEDDVLSGGEFTSEAVTRSRDALNEAKTLAGTLSPGWEVASNETDRHIGDSLKAGKEPVFESISSILLIDGSVSSSLASDESRALGQCIQKALDELSTAITENPADRLDDVIVEDLSDDVKPLADSPESEEVPSPDDGGFKPTVGLLGAAGQSWENPFLNLSPDEGFRAPDEVEEFDFATPDDTAPIQKPLKKTARVSGFTDLTKEKAEVAPPVEAEEEQDVEAETEEPEVLVLFRSNDVGIWGKTIYRGTNHRARSLESIPDWNGWISMERLDTGERVFVRLDGDDLDDLDRSTSIGFNASNELFYGARHLGVFSEACPNEVETRFTYGGWGFGHRVSPGGNSAESLQAVGWEGKEIPSDTIFEICLHRELPEQRPQDRVLGES